MQTMIAQVLDEITHRLVVEFQPEQVILFGSYAWGKPDQDSDVDLMVIVSDSVTSCSQRMVRAQQCLNGIGVSKDVIVKTRAEFDFFRDVRASLEYKVANHGLVLYERSKAAAHTKLASQSAQ